VKPSLKLEGITKSHDEPKKRRNSMEGKHQAAAFKWLSLQYPKIRLVTFHVPNGGYRKQKVYKTRSGKTKRWSPEAKYLQGQGVTAGVPDVLCLYPSRNYHGFACEFKFGDNELTDKQSEFHTNLTALGYYCCVCYTSFEFQDHLQYYIGKCDTLKLSKNSSVGRAEAR
jgi:hypothetical protein